MFLLVVEETFRVEYERERGVSSGMFCRAIRL